MLGTELGRVFLSSGEVWAAGRDELDITDAGSVHLAFDSFRPDVVIHSAAWTDVDGCEGDSRRAFLVNRDAAAHVAREAEGTGAYLVAISTDFVFDGEKRTQYIESDPTSPVSVYGLSKLEGEQSVLEECPRASIVRTAWVYGAAGKGDFVRAIRKAGAVAEGPLLVVDDQVGAPTWSSDLAAALRSLVESRGRGVYHVTNGGEVSRYELARRILDLSGLESVAVEPVSSTESNRPAKRPAYSVLGSERWGDLGLEPLRHWDLALKAFLAQEGDGHV